MSICWACHGSFPGERLTRAHVVARSHGGSVDPRNFFLLCEHCHLEQPDGASREAQEAWLFSAPSVWEWTGAIVDALTGMLEASAARLRRRPETVREFYGSEKDAILACIPAGYRGAAGLVNGRANALQAIVRLFEAWEPALQDADSARRSA